MMGGRLKGMICAGTPEVSRASVAISPFTPSAGVARSSKGSSARMRKAEFDCARPFSIE